MAALKSNGCIFSIHILKQSLSCCITHALYVSQAIQATGAKSGVLAGKDLVKRTQDS
jgi:hypothetical protein